MSTRNRFALLMALTAACASPASAQVVTGRVVEASTGGAVVGAFVRLVDTLGVSRAQVLADTGGRFVLRAPATGRYRLRAERIGFERKETPFFQLTRVVRNELIEMPDEPVQLAGIQVEGKRECQIQEEEGTALARVWGEARKALQVSAWTEAQGGTEYEISRFERTTTSKSALPVEKTWTMRGVGARPFGSLPARELLSGGFVQSGPGGPTYYGPDAAVLLSDGFLESHCFSLERPRDGLIGLKFEPRRRVTHPDIGGTLWVDLSTNVLRSIDFEYRGAPLAAQVGAGGHMEFERASDGTLIIRSWRLRAPVLGLQQGGIWGPGVGFSVAGVKETGGRILSIRPIAPGQIRVDGPS